MQLQRIGTTISADGNYTEDSTIQVTAVDATTHVPITTFTGKVIIAEDDAKDYSKYSNYGACLVYVSGACSADNSVTITSNGTATFLARSAAIPKTEMLEEPLDALLTTEPGYPMDKGEPLSVPQWVVTGQWDPMFVKGANGRYPYDWFQKRVLDIYAAARGEILSSYVLGRVRSYALSTAIIGTAKTQGDHMGDNQAPVVFNAIQSGLRFDLPGNAACGMPAPPKGLTNAIYHEARHAYQNSLATLANDEDQDALVNSIGIVPTSIFLDTTDSRLVCDQGAAPGSQVQGLAFKGPRNKDAVGSTTLGAAGTPGVIWALEMDAFYFAFLNQ
jgi:hypothetical protein